MTRPRSLGEEAARFLETMCQLQKVRVDYKMPSVRRSVQYGPSNLNGRDAFDV